MAIYNIFEKEELSSQEGIETQNVPGKGRFFSAVASRFFFLCLLIADLFWGLYAGAVFLYSLVGSLFHKSAFLRMRQKSHLSLKRALVCGVSLFVAIFSPAFGLMIACGYFLVYDKEGIQEVVPSSLQDQFKGIFNES